MKIEGIESRGIPFRRINGLTKNKEDIKPNRKYHRNFHVLVVLVVNLERVIGLQLNTSPRPQTLIKAIPHEQIRISQTKIDLSTCNKS